MRTDVISFILVSENRKKIVRTILDYPKRQWSCSALEDLTNIPHATVFRTLSGLRDFNILRSVKINRKDILYELAADLPMTKELEKIIDIEKITTKKIAKDFVKKIKSKNIKSIILYGSSVSGKLRPDSDIDILVVLYNHNKIIEKEIYDMAANFSSKLNRTISINIMDIGEIRKEKNSQFIKSVGEYMELIYGKTPF